MTNRKNPYPAQGVSELESLAAAGSHSRRDFLRLGIATAAAGLIASPALAARSKVKRIRYAHSSPTTHGWHLSGRTVQEGDRGEISRNYRSNDFSEHPDGY